MFAHGELVVLLPEAAEMQKIYDVANKLSVLKDVKVLCERLQLAKRMYGSRLSFPATGPPDPGTDF